MKGKGHIVVVETDDLIRALLHRWLVEEAYTVTSEAEAPSAGRNRPTLVIADVPNPRDAQELIRGLKAAYAAPILALSARFQRGLASSRGAARDLGVRGVLPIPFTRRELLCAVQEAIKEAD